MYELAARLTTIQAWKEQYRNNQGSYYRRVLGVASNASVEDIKQSYRRLALESFPDQFNTLSKTHSHLYDQITELAREYNLAFEYLVRGSTQPPTSGTPDRRQRAQEPLKVTMLELFELYRQGKISDTQFQHALRQYLYSTSARSQTSFQSQYDRTFDRSSNSPGCIAQSCGCLVSASILLGCGWVGINILNGQLGPEIQRFTDELQRIITNIF